MVRAGRRPACASITARAPAGTLPPVSSKSAGPLGSTCRGSGARIQTNSRLLRAKSARTVCGWKRPCDRRAGSLCARLAEQRGWPGNPVLRLVPSAAAEWIVAGRTTRVKTLKPCALSFVHPTGPARRSAEGQAVACTPPSASLGPQPGSAPPPSRLQGTSDSYSVTILRSLTLHFTKEEAGQKPPVGLRSHSCPSPFLSFLLLNYKCKNERDYVNSYVKLKIQK